MKIKKNSKENFYTSNGFNLISVIIIIIVTAIASAITTGVIANNNFKSKDGISYTTLLEDKNLSEFLDVYSSVLTDYYEDVNKEEMIDAAISAMLNYLGDSYTTYMDTNQTESLAEKLEGKYQGIGIVISNNVIESILNDSPASTSGLQVGDVIISINGNSVENIGGEAISNIIKNNSELDKVTIEVKRNEEIYTYEIKTANLYVPAVNYYMIDNTKIGYIYVSVFSKTVSEQFKNALNDLENQGMEKLIIDVRKNTGGYLSQAEIIASIFLNKDKIIYSLENKLSTTAYYDKTDESRNYPIVVLIDGDSASASEILASALKDSYGATLIGTKSFGKGKVQQTVTLKDNSMAKYTSAKWLRPNGECIDGIGIIPDINIELDYQKDEEGKVVSITDTQILKAIEYLQ